MALEDRHVTATPEGVSLDVVLAGLGSRFTADPLDFLHPAGAAGGGVAAARPGRRRWRRDEPAPGQRVPGAVRLPRLHRILRGVRDADLGPVDLGQAGHRAPGGPGRRRGARLLVEHPAEPAAAHRHHPLPLLPGGQRPGAGHHPQPAPRRPWPGGTLVVRTRTAASTVLAGRGMGRRRPVDRGGRRAGLGARLPLRAGRAAPGPGPLGTCRR